jgi:hypothetical protein
LMHGILKRKGPIVCSVPFHARVAVGRKKDIVKIGQRSGIHGLSLLQRKY